MSRPRCPIQRPAGLCTNPHLLPLLSSLPLLCTRPHGCKITPEQGFSLKYFIFQLHHPAQNLVHGAHRQRSLRVKTAANVYLVLRVRRALRTQSASPRTILRETPPGKARAGLEAPRTNRAPTGTSPVHASLRTTLAGLDQEGSGVEKPPRDAQLLRPGAEPRRPPTPPRHGGQGRNGRVAPDHGAADPHAALRPGGGSHRAPAAARLSPAGAPPGYRGPGPSRPGGRWPGARAGRRPRSAPRAGAGQVSAPGAPGPSAARRPGEGRPLPPRPRRPAVTGSAAL